MKPAEFWKRTGGTEVLCELCRQHCRIGEGKRGLCGVRENRAGTLYSRVYGRAVSEAVDPIEKKPLYHFIPGTQTLSVATLGCNFRCRHCQNHRIAHLDPKDAAVFGSDLSPERIVAQALENGCRSLSFTYTEPTVFFEYARDTAAQACEAGLRNVFVTNGYIERAALRNVRPYLHAVNIDLKFFRDDIYRRICNARLEPVLDSIRYHYELGIWMELTTLVIPTLNDSDADLEGMAEFIAGIDPDIPWHLSRFFPTCELTDLPATPADTLRRARAAGRRAGLRYVYIGNLRVPDAERTRCPQCDAALVERDGFRVTANRLRNGACPQCATVPAGVWR